MDIRGAGKDFPEISTGQDLANQEAQEAQQSEAQQSEAPQQAVMDIIQKVREEQLEALIQAGEDNTGITQQPPTGGGGGTPSDYHSLPNAGNMPYFDQGTANACGTTSLAMIMTYLGVPETKDEIDAEIRRMNTFTSPEDLVDFARSKGLEAEGYNNGSWEDVKSQIDQGHPVQCMIQADYDYGDGTSINGQHYVAITGYGTDPTTGEEYVTFHDPNKGVGDPNSPTPHDIKMPLSKFKEMWGGIGFGFKNYYVAYGPPGSNLPPGNDNGVEGQLGALDGITNITNGLDRIGSPDSAGDFIHGLFEFPAGVFQTVLCGVGGLVQLGGQWLNNAVEGIPVLENFVQPIGDIINGAGAAFADIFDGACSAVDDVGNAFGSLADGDFGGFASGLGDAVGDAVGGVVDAASDAVSAVGDAIGDFVSGW
jgi:uncharacterized protein YvpB